MEDIIDKRITLEPEPTFIVPHFRFYFEGKFKFSVACARINKIETSTDRFTAVFFFASSESFRKKFKQSDYDNILKLREDKLLIEKCVDDAISLINKLNIEYDTGIITSE